MCVCCAVVGGLGAVGVAVRWGGRASAFNTAQWGTTSASVSDAYIDHFTTAVLQWHARSPLLSKPKYRKRRGQPRAEALGPEFVLRHFAGSIKYACSHSARGPCFC